MATTIDADTSVEKRTYGIESVYRGFLYNLEPDADG